MDASAKTKAKTKFNTKLQFQTKLI